MVPVFPWQQERRSAAYDTQPQLGFFRGNSMAGKKGRSGPPGNLNNVQNPWRSFWARKALRAQDKWILPALEHYLDEAIEDAGGDDISSGKKHTLEIAQIARGCAMLILTEVKEKGFIVITPDGWDIHPGLKELPRFLALELTARRNVGLERRHKTLSLQDILSADHDNGKGETP